MSALSRRRTNEVVELGQRTAGDEAASSVRASAAGAGFKRWLAAIAVTGLILRVVVAVVLRNHEVDGDGWFYHYQALLNADGTWFVNPISLKEVALHPPAWSMFLTVLSWLHLRSWLLQQLACALVGVATIVVVGLAGRRLGGERVGLIAAAIAALWAGFWLWERSLLSETLTLLLVAAIILATYRLRDRLTLGRAAVLGLLLGAMVATRSDEILVVAFLVIPILLGGLRAGRGRERRQHLLAAGTILGIVALVSLPWSVYNTLRFEHPVFLSNGLGNVIGGSYCPATFSGPALGSFSQNCATYRLSGHAGADQSEQDLVLRKAAFNYAKKHASRLPIVILAREGRAFGLYSPFQQNQREADFQNSPVLPLRLDVIGLWLLAVPAIGGVVVLRRRRVAIYPLVSFIVVVVLATGLTDGQARYRAAANVPIALFAAVGIDAALTWWSSRRRASLADARDTPGGDETPAEPVPA